MNISSFLSDYRKLTVVLGASIGLLVLLTIILVIVRSFGGLSQGPAGVSTPLQVWGVFDDRAAFEEAIRSFKQQTKVDVQYRVFTFAEYERGLVEALAAGEGPDVMMIHHTWLGRFANKLVPMPSNLATADGAPLMTLQLYTDTFVDVAYFDLVRGNSIYAMPLYVDSLALYYNRDLLASAGIAQPPKTWKEFQDAVKALTVYDADRNITRAGASVGTARNINRASDILMMLMLQSGVRMTDDDGSSATFSRSVDNVNVGEQALQFYTDFANPRNQTYTWNDSQDYSFDAFATERSAMMINYAHQISALTKAAPRLNWGVAPIPQASSAESRTYANYWALGVSKASQNPEWAWRFVHHVTAGPSNVSYLNVTARPAARRDLIEQQKNLKDIGIFALQSLTARSWYQIENTTIEGIFLDMIDAVNFGQATIKDALKSAESRVTVLLSR
jgi:ABC-type glycerol-3-phosphate transport system substrate-binding protein